MLAAFLPSLLATLFIIICILLIGVVLLQKGRGGGLSAAFGGMGSSAFGTRVGDVLTWVTIVMTGLFLLLATTVTLTFKPSRELVATPVFTPNPETFQNTDSFQVRIDCATTGAVIYYTADGADPTKKSKLYGGAFTARVGQTLKARAFLAGQPDSKIAVAEYRLRAVAPAIPTTGPAALPPMKPATAPAAPVVTPATAPATPAVPAPKPAAPTTAPALVPAK